MTKGMGKKRKSRSRKTKVRKTKSWKKPARRKKLKVYDVGDFEEKVRKIKERREREGNNAKRIIILLLFLSILLILMYIGSEIKGNFSRSVCIDSDGGLNYYIPGVVEQVGNKGMKFFNDSCVNSTTLKEFYCDGNDVKSEYHACDGECVNGRCVPKTLGKCSKGQCMTPEECRKISGVYAGACSGHKICCEKIELVKW